MNRPTWDLPALIFKPCALHETVAQVGNVTRVVDELGADCIRTPVQIANTLRVVKEAEARYTRALVSVV